MPKTIQCEILEIVERAPDVKSFRLKPSESVDYQAGQFMSVELDVDGASVKKYFTISNAPVEENLEFTKKITDSPFSAALNDLKPGDKLSVTVPMGRFTLERGGDKIVFLSGGIGITPIRSICEDVNKKHLDKDIVLIYGNHREEDIVFKNELDLMAHNNKYFRVVHALDAPSEEWKGYRGYITADIIIKEVPDYQERTFFLCGPPKMVEHLSTLLSGRLSIPEDHIVVENFTGY